MKGAASQGKYQTLVHSVQNERVGFRVKCATCPKPDVFQLFTKPVHGADTRAHTPLPHTKRSAHHRHAGTVTVPSVSRPHAHMHIVPSYQLRTSSQELRLRQASGTRFGSNFSGPAPRAGLRIRVRYSREILRTRLPDPDSDLNLIQEHHGSPNPFACILEKSSRRGESRTRGGTCARRGRRPDRGGLAPRKGEGVQHVQVVVAVRDGAPSEDQQVALHVGRCHVGAAGARGRARRLRLGPLLTHHVHDVQVPVRAPRHVLPSKHVHLGPHDGCLRRQPHSRVRLCPAVHPCHHASRALLRVVARPSSRHRETFSPNAEVQPRPSPAFWPALLGILVGSTLLDPLSACSATK